MQKEVNEMQKKINELFWNVFKNYKGGLKLSVPLIPRLSSNYLKNRFLVIGQETNTWYRETDDDLKNIFVDGSFDKIEANCLINRYDKFAVEHVKKYRGNFWKFNRALYEKNVLSDEIVVDGRLSHCWMDLFSVEACRNKKDSNNRPTKNEKLRDNIVELQKTLLFDSINILEPKVILFLTGHGLDEVVRKIAINSKSFPKKTVDPDGILNDKMLAEIQLQEEGHPLKGVKIFRSYHPGYFMGRIKANKEIKRKLKEKGTKISKYYYEVLIEALKDSMK